MIEIPLDWRSETFDVVRASSLTEDSRDAILTNHVAQSRLFQTSSALQGCLETWVKSLELRDAPVRSEVTGIIRLVGLAAPACFWSGQGWTDEDHLKRLRAIALWTLGSRIYSTLLNRNLASPRTLQTLFSQAWNKEQSSPPGSLSPEISELTRVMCSALQECRRFLDNHVNARANWPSATWSTFESYMQMRCLSSQAIPMLLLMVALGSQDGDVESVSRVSQELLHRGATYAVILQDVLEHEHGPVERPHNIVDVVQSDTLALSVRAVLLDCKRLHTANLETILECVSNNGQAERQISHAIFGCLVIAVIHPSYSGTAEVLASLSPTVFGA
eukprot:c1800_g1_i2.p1 GENE.c1800_g1_i2~~c1800_g1_i2.p1  ORF type:complete len:332 (-),score=64.97 c1800_g1_i2:77-1072(-)